MKKLNILFVITIFASSCAPVKYFQVYKTNPSQGVIGKDKIVFESPDCSISYNLWTNEGEGGFTFLNKTEDDLIIDLANSFFVLNGVAQPYFQNRTITHSLNSGSVYSSLYPYSSTVSGLSSGLAVSYVEQAEIIIPPRTKKDFSGFKISASRYISDDLERYPTHNKIKISKFEEANSPFVFYNIITYKMGVESKRMENKFFVSEITNMISSEMHSSEYYSGGEPLKDPVSVFKNASPDKFYFEYFKYYH